MDNLRKFQNQETIIKPVPKRLSLHHKSHSYSSPSSQRSSYIIEDDRIIFTSPPLSAELKDRGYQEAGGIISSEFTTTPQNEEENPFENKKRRSNSPFFGSSTLWQDENETSEQNINQAVEELLSTIENEEVEQSISQAINQQELLTEIEQLKEQLVQSENAYQSLSEGRITLNQKIKTALAEKEKSLQEFNQKELV